MNITALTRKQIERLEELAIMDERQFVDLYTNTQTHYLIISELSINDIQLQKLNKELHELGFDTQLKTPADLPPMGCLPEEMQAGDENE